VDVRGPIPFHVGKAYGIARPGAIAKPAAAAQPGMARLVSGAVSVAAEPEAVPSARMESPAGSASVAAGGAFPLYTRAADRIEVATSIAIGRTVDRTA
jgi:hypothetical protein